MQEQTQPREDNWQPSLCSKPEHMFMNDKQLKLVRSSTAQCNDPLKQMQPGDLLQHQWITAKALALRHIHLLQRRSKPIQSMQRVTIYQDSAHLPSELYVLLQDI